MKIALALLISTFLLLDAAPAAVSARQTEANGKTQKAPTAAPAVFRILKFSWQHRIERPSRDADLYRTPNQVAADDWQARDRQRRQGPRPKETQTLPEVAPLPDDDSIQGTECRVTLINDSKKTIVAIAWAYLFLNPGSREEETRHAFVSRQKIKPGARKELREFSPLPPNRVVDARLESQQPQEFERVIITRIEYSNGSVWEK